MNKLTIISLTLFLCFNIHSQEINGIVEYGHKQSLGMGAPIGVDYNASLIFNSQESKYVFAQDSLEGGQIREYVKIEKDKDNMFVVPKGTSKLGFQYYLDKNSKKIFSRDIGFRYVEEDVAEINWQILNDKKNIGNIECTKAKGKFRGRTYTAWFTTSIPLPYGPWKLQGLPGLILEAYDTNKEVFFYFKSVQYPVTSKIEIKKPNPAIEGKNWITLTEHKKICVEKYKRATENGRMIAENFDSTESENQKSKMGNYYIEIFDED